MTPTQRVGVLGSNGFVGSGVVEAIERAGKIAVALPRVSLLTGLTPASDSLHQSSFREAAISANSILLDALSDIDVVINAAGLADPTSDNVQALWEGNVLLPAVLDLVAAEADIARLVHVSSAAVLGNQTLTEERTCSPLTPYGQSKADAEAHLLEHSVTPTVIYRATSVMGPGRAIVERLVSFYSGRIVPIFGDGSAPLPLSTLPNTSDAIVHLVHQTMPLSIALQPWEGVTQRSLANSLMSDGSRIVRVPVPPFARKILSAADKLPGGIASQFRRIELLVFGQPQEATVLASTGYKASADASAYLAELAAR